jgi:hypothetical protein
MIDWKRVLGFGTAGLAASALAWFLLRAYTGIFDILNVRVFVGVPALLPAMMLPVWGFNPKILTKDAAAVIPKSVSGTAAFCAVAAILLGEFAASLVKGAPISWERFNLICLAVSVVVPFQFEQVLKKK